MDKPKTYTITIPADKVDDILSALSSACDNAAHFARLDEDDDEVREVWLADERLLGELHDKISAAREAEGGAE
jgi:hypothetical protein